MLIKLKRGDNVITCPNCGKNNKDVGKFCVKCGSPLSEQKYYCPNCLTDYFNGEKFCMNCGGKLVKKTIIENNMDENENTFRFMGTVTPKEIRNKFSNINNQFIKEGKIASVEEIMDRAGVKYEIIVKDRRYKILGYYEMDNSAPFNNSGYVLTPKEIRIKYNSTNQMFISKGRIVSVEEIMNYEGIRYRIIEKNKLYQVFD